MQTRGSPRLLSPQDRPWAQGRSWYFGGLGWNYNFRPYYKIKLFPIIFVYMCICIFLYKDIKYKKILIAHVLQWSWILVGLGFLKTILDFVNDISYKHAKLYLWDTQKGKKTDIFWRFENMILRSTLFIFHIAQNIHYFQMVLCMIVVYILIFLEFLKIYKYDYHYLLNIVTGAHVH
jgi:hypothetical protein